MSLSARKKKPQEAKEEVHVVLDSTGLKVYGPGEWVQKRHQEKRRRTWRKLHLAVDPITRDETTLLLAINTGFPTDLQERFEGLVSRREAGTITASELQELIALTEQVEHNDAERLRAPARLAELRQTTMSELMNALGVRPVGDTGRAGT